MLFWAWKSDGNEKRCFQAWNKSKSNTSDQWIMFAGANPEKGGIYYHKINFTAMKFVFIERVLVRYWDMGWFTMAGHLLLM